VTTKILTIGHKHPKWVIAACEDFLVRLPKSYQPKIEALPLATRPHVSYDAKQALVFKNNEGDSILKKFNLKIGLSPCILQDNFTQPQN
jgi:23S rRNA pseudoU1915 N3-methylase RlmH